jgi:hypothetical protein
MLYKNIVLACLFLLLSIVSCQETKPNQPKESRKPDWFDNHRFSKAIKLERSTDEGIEKQKIPSPDGKFVLYQKAIRHKDTYGEELWSWEIWIKDLESNQPDQLIYEYGRWAEILWSPNSKFIVINDHLGSDTTWAYIIALNKDNIFEVRKNDINKEVETAFVNATKDIWGPHFKDYAGQSEEDISYFYHHFYIVTLEWSPDSTEILLRAYGHGLGDDNKGYGSGSCYFIYSVTEDKIARHLELMDKQLGEDNWVNAWAKAEKARVPEAYSGYEQLAWPSEVPDYVMELWARDDGEYGLTEEEVIKRWGKRPINILVNESIGAKLFLYEKHCYKFSADKCVGYAPRASNYEKYFMQPDL